MGITLAKQDGKLMEEYGLLSPYIYTISIRGERKSNPECCEKENRGFWAVNRVSVRALTKLIIHVFQAVFRHSHCATLVIPA